MRPVASNSSGHTAHSRPPRLLVRKRILIVNCYADETRGPVSRTHKVQQAMGPAYLAGAFAPELCEIRLYSELAGGPLEDERLLGWPDMLVLTGLTTALDRMLHLTAYTKTKNPRVVVVAGGHAVRALPHYCRRFFDYACLGDIEELREAVTEVFGSKYTGALAEPRFDLVPWVNRIGYVESSPATAISGVASARSPARAGRIRRTHLTPCGDTSRPSAAGLFWCSSTTTSTIRTAPRFAPSWS